MNYNIVLFPSQDHVGADKLSLCSGRSLRSSERSYRDEMDSMSLSSGHKRMVLGQRMSKLNSRNMSSSTLGGSTNCIAENVCLEIKETCDDQEDVKHETAEQQQQGVTSGEALQSIVIHSVSDKYETQQPQASSQDAISTESISAKASTVAVGGGGVAVDNSSSSSSKSEAPEGPSMTKTAILRNIFFSQISSTSSTSAKAKE